MKSKHWLCLKYIFRHRYYVNKAGKVCGVNLWRRLKHDWSKFLPGEFLAYSEFFYGNKSERIPGQTGKESIITSDVVRERFDLAFMGHCRRNDHHWDRWIQMQDGGPYPHAMPEQAWREMCADWLAMQYTLQGNWDAIVWYSFHQRYIILHDETRYRVESLLKRAGAQLTVELENKLGVKNGR